MNFKDYWVGIPTAERPAFAERCGTTAGMLHQIAFGNRNANAKLASAIERESGGTVLRQDFFPTDWQEIWPELAQPEQVSTTPDEAT